MKVLLFIFSLLLLVASCGKSPLLKPKETLTTGISGLEVAKNFKTTNQNLSINWLSPINSIDEGRALLIVKQNEMAVDLTNQFSVFLWMPTMGHGSSPIKIKKLATGIYQLSEIYFIMDGFWQLKVQLKNGASLLDEVNFEYNL